MNVHEYFDVEEGAPSKNRKRGNCLYLLFLEIGTSMFKLELEFICFSFTHIGPRSLNAETNKNGKSIVGDGEEVEDTDEGKNF